MESEVLKCRIFDNFGMDVAENDGEEDAKEYLVVVPLTPRKRGRGGKVTYEVLMAGL